MKKRIISDKQFKRQVAELSRQISLSNWCPDYIVGITRGGLYPALLLSHYFNVPMHTLNVSLRDGYTGPESNLWMAEDAFGCVPLEEQDTYQSRWDIGRRKNILIVDDINDTGTTLNWIKDDWQGSCFPSEASWETVWGNNVRTAVVIDNEASMCSLDIDYAALEINKSETPEWIVFPYEEWWR